ncbi:MULTISPECIES: ATP-binding cassette domain-containing protein [Fluoribacter]|uniref:ABC-2 type transport system ATP-binding protein n=1 Tax=Fluoribacter gormanii TaxID=464 RepID=A0A377GH79_9GAMM|nr:MULTISPECIES: ABC transporter ATP-binding protein [Fluoribacter]KTD02725.1 putative fused transporter subunits of ABC superfamily: ATP-binding component [Fluoribacter gormanii]MCW8386885.1 ABC transporter ATP-binding protein [Fluoribacter dumoffii]SIR59996.1 ABC-2 type transport system ATP-binding protein [Fluoribacter gormanii]STO23742.1 Lipopolysaccharide export system ATP-binding protein LptB [Fluoribacter gormanii]
MNINIQLNHVSKSYESRQLLNNISYQFTKNIYHIIGSNGVGKSTLLRLLIGLELPDSGSVIINGNWEVSSHNLMAKNIYYVPDDLEVYPFLTGREFLNWIAQARAPHGGEIENILECFHLNPHMNTKISNMSFGTKKKFLLATALIGTPDFIILDEPMNGLDQNSQSILLTILEKKSRNSGLILTCHEEDKIAQLHPYKLQLSNQQLTELKLERNKLV